MNNESSASAGDLKALLDEAANQLRIGSLYLWTRTELAKALKGMPEVWGLSPAFLSITLNSLYDESILHLTRLVENRNDTLNLPAIEKWIGTYEACVPGLPAERVRKEVRPEFQTRIKEIQQEVAEIVRIRNQEIAHLNLEKLKARNGASAVKYSDIERAYRDVHQLLDELSEKCLGEGSA